jgi:serine/threonine protein kinase
MENKFLIISTLSTNDKRIVYKAKDKITGKLIILKKILRNNKEDYEKELKCIDDVKSNFINKYLSIYEEDEYLYLTSDFSDITLHYLIWKLRLFGRFLTEKVWLYYELYCIFHSLFGVVLTKFHLQLWRYSMLDMYIVIYHQIIYLFLMNLTLD